MPPETSKIEQNPASAETPENREYCTDLSTDFLKGREAINMPRRPQKALTAEKLGGLFLCRQGSLGMFLHQLLDSFQKLIQSERLVKNGPGFKAGLARLH